MSSPRLLVSIPDGRLREALGTPSPGVEFLEWDMTVPSPVDAIEIVVVPYLQANMRLSRLTGVRTRLVQGQSAGFDGVEPLLPPGVVYANAASVHETSTSELALALILASQRAIPDFVRSSDARRWAPRWAPSLADRTVLIVGYGAIGRAIASRLLAFETTLLRVARTARFDDYGPVYPMTTLFDLLPRADVVIVCVPLTEATTHLIDDRFLSALRDGSLVVNVARGPVADTSALVSHARTGRLRFALDVTDPEPLPDDHPLFNLANVLISPHVGGASSAMTPRMARLVRAQITRIGNGEPPLNVVLRT